MIKKIMSNLNPINLSHQFISRILGCVGHTQFIRKSKAVGANDSFLLHVFKTLYDAATTTFWSQITMLPMVGVSPINVIPAINVIKINHKCNTKHKCNNF